MVTYTHTVSVIYARKGMVAIQCSCEQNNMVYVALKHVQLYGSTMALWILCMGQHGLCNIKTCTAVCFSNQQIFQAILALLVT
jgi:hypothetical protein